MQRHIINWTSLPLTAVCLFILAVNSHGTFQKTGGEMVLTDDLLTGVAGSAGMSGGASSLHGTLGQTSAMEASGPGAGLQGGYFSRAVLNPGTFAYSEVNFTSMTALWSGPVQANPAGVVYDLAVSTASNFSVIHSSLSTSGATGVLAGLLPNTTYYSRLRARYMEGDASAWVSMGSTRTLAVSGKPGVPAGEVLGVSSISWTWANAAGASAYKVYYASAPGSLAGSAAGAQFSHVGLSSNTAYGIVVAGSNGLGNGPLSEPATVYTFAAAPEAMEASQVWISSAALGWGLNGNPAGTIAQVWRSTDALSFAPVYEGAAMSYAAAALRECSVYYFKARNKNGDGVYSGFASPVSFITNASTPAAPNALAAEPAAGNRISLSWEFSPSEISAYRLYCDNGTGPIDYAVPCAVFSSTVSAWATTPLAAGSVYKFGLRAVTRCGVEEKNTSVFASAYAIGSPSGVRAAIKVPQTGKRIKGNRVTVVAEIINGVLSLTKQVRFQYRLLNGGAWTDIPAADGNHPNPDPDAPYFVHWDVDALGVVSAATYELRALAADITGTDDAAAPTITVVIDPVDYDISETLAGGELKKEQKINNAVSSTVQAADDGSALVSKVIIPAGALNESTVTVSVVNNPSHKPAAPQGSEELDLGVQIALSNTQSQLSGGNLSTVVLSFSDDNGDGLVDGSSARVDQLKMYSAHDLGDAWTLLPSSTDNLKKTVSGTTAHFSFFALFAPLAADLDTVRVYPVPFVPNDGRTDNGVPYAASNPDSGIVFDNLTAAVKIKIYTLTGQLVADIGSANSSGKLQWDGRNEDGKNAASGGYIAVIISSGHKTVTRKLLIIR